MVRVVALVAVVACGHSTAATHDAALLDASPPIAAGCITDVSAGDHTFTCDGLQTDVRIPAACEAPGCGLILELHGDTGTGLLMDAHTNLRALGDQHGYIVVAPTGPPFGGQPGSTWHATNDPMLVDIVQQFASVFRVDAKKIHVTGFSRGGFVTWRMICDHSDLFVSAAPGGAGFGDSFGETTCFENGSAPARDIPILFLMGRTDMAVGYSTMQQIRDAAIAHYAATGPNIVAQDTTYTDNVWTAAAGVTIETFDHAYHTVANGAWGYAQGHCIPGSTMDPYAPQYAIPCQLPNSFVWGEQVMRFFLANPGP